MKQNELLLEGVGLRKRYGRKWAVKGVSISLRKGEIVGLLGPNGAGKTTTFYMIMGLVKPDGGRVFFGGEEITHLPVHRRARKGIGYLSQEPSVFANLTVEQNLRLVLEENGVKGTEAEDRISQALEEMGIYHLRSEKAFRLSGGEKRRVEIARCLILQPSFLLLDEPFTGIDPKTILELQELILGLREEKGIGILITDHNVRETLAIVDRAYLIYEGEILFSGTPEEILSHKETRRVYLGEGFSI